MNFDVEAHRIFECITGSQLYGTNTELSDTDYRGVVVEPLDILLHPFQGFDQQDSGFKEEDRCLYSLKKFIKLCADANPNIVELLFVPEKNVIFSTPVWERLMDNKHLFLSKKAKYTFSGYAFAQLNKIKLHRQWFINPPKEKPTRKAFGLKEVPLVSGDNLDAALNLPFSILKPECADEFRQEKEYRVAKKAWDNYMSWKNNRNPKRMALEEKFHFDAKHGSHLIRLLQEGKELLLTGNITFPLPNAEEITAIKNGKYSYEEILEMAEKMDKDFDLWYNESTLPHSADREGLAELYLDIIK